MKNKIILSAVILSAFLAISAGSAIAVSANADANEKTAVTDNDKIDKSFMTECKLDVCRITDSKGNEEDPYLLFGSSFRYAHYAVFRKDGSFGIFIGANAGNDPSGTYEYNPYSKKMFLHYNDGFNAAAYVAVDKNGNNIIKVPVMLWGEIYIIDFSL